MVNLKQASFSCGWCFWDVLVRASPLPAHGRASSLCTVLEWTSATAAMALRRTRVAAALSAQTGQETIAAFMTGVVEMDWSV